MVIDSVFATAASVIASLGGGALIVFGFSNWLGKVWANRLMVKEKAAHQVELESLRNTFLQDIESYKVKLKKSEFIFEKEFKAASELVSLKLSIFPEYSYPTMDWEDVCEYLAYDSESIEKKVGEFVSKHGAILGEDVLSKLSNCKGVAGEIKFKVSANNVPYEAKSEAEKMYEELSLAEENLLKKVHSQISV